MISRRLATGIATAMLMMAGTALAQRHNAGVAPPTGPAKPQPLAPMSSGMGPLQFTTVDYGVPAPQSLTRQLQAEDDRIRAASLSAIGAPGQYLQRGHIPYPRAVDLQFATLGTSDELDAILTAELDQHMVSAILVPEDGTWHRVATMIYPSNLGDQSIMPSPFVRLRRSVLQRNKFRVIFTAMTSLPNGDYTENEAYVRVVNNKAVVTLSLVSAARVCENVPAPGRSRGGCDITIRWLQADTTAPGQQTTMISGTGHLTAREAADPLSHTRDFETSRLRTFTCQAFVFNDAAQRYDPAAQPAPCPLPH